MINSTQRESRNQGLGDSMIFSGNIPATITGSRSFADKYLDEKIVTALFVAGTAAALMAFDYAFKTATRSNDFYRDNVAPSHYSATR